MPRGFSETMSVLRRERGLSQRTAAADLHISQALLSHYENGAREPGLDFVCRACDYYGVSADYLLGRTADPTDYARKGSGKVVPIRAAEPAIIKLYSRLDSADRMKAEGVIQGMLMQDKYTEGLKAAHVRTDVDVTDDMIAADNAMPRVDVNSPSTWGVLVGPWKSDGSLRQRGIVKIGPFKTGKRLHMGKLIAPHLHVDHGFAVAVLFDISDPLRRVIILHQRQGGSGLPDAKHADQRDRASWQAQKHKVLPPDLLLLQPGIHLPGHPVHLPATKTAGVLLIRERFSGRVGRHAFRPCIQKIFRLIQE